MFKRLRSALAWAEILSRFRQGDRAGASRAAERYRKLGKINAMFVPLDATIDVLNRKSEEARLKFQRVVDEMVSDPSEDQKYIYLYSSYFLCLIDKGEQCEAIRLKGISLKSSNRLRNTLPFPEEPID